VIDIDGVRVNFPDGWGLIRASNTQPALVLRFEATSPEALKRIQGFVEGELKKFI
jgi:phosphomannomutase/phosphoglucomutase